MKIPGNKILMNLTVSGSFPSVVLIRNLLSSHGLQSRFQTAPVLEHAPDEPNFAAPFPSSPCWKGMERADATEVMTYNGWSMLDESGSGSRFSAKSITIHRTSSRMKP